MTSGLAGGASAKRSHAEVAEMANRFLHRRKSECDRAGSTCPKGSSCERRFLCLANERSHRRTMSVEEQRYRMALRLIGAMMQLSGWLISGDLILHSKAGYAWKLHRLCAALPASHHLIMAALTPVYAAKSTATSRPSPNGFSSGPTRICTSCLA